MRYWIPQEQNEAMQKGLLTVEDVEMAAADGTSLFLSLFFLINNTNSSFIFNNTDF